MKIVIREGHKQAGGRNQTAAVCEGRCRKPVAVVTGRHLRLSGQVTYTLEDGKTVLKGVCPRCQTPYRLLEPEKLLQEDLTDAKNSS